MRAWTWRWLALLLCLLTACGGGTDRTKAQVRLVNASSGYAALDLVVHGARVFSSVPYAETATYTDQVDPDEADAMVTAPGSSTALVSMGLSVRKNRQYTILAYGPEGALQAIQLDDNTDAPDEGKTLVRFVNAAPDAGAVDVYLTGATDTLTNATPVQSNVAVGGVNAYISLDSGNRRLRVTATGSKSDIRLDIASIALTSRQLQTVVITTGKAPQLDHAGGLLVNALLLVDRGGIARADNQQARVRVAAAVAGGPNISATANGTALLLGAAPGVGNYVAIAAGTPVVAVTVNGTAVAVPTRALVPGGDYTLNVYGPAPADGTALASWVPDDNRLPTDPNKAKLRLVNDIDDGSAVSLSIEFAPIAVDTPAGQASDYKGDVDPSTNAQIVVMSGGKTLITVTDKIIVANAVYSLFVAGRPTGALTEAPVPILRKDR